MIIKDLERNPKETFLQLAARLNEAYRVVYPNNFVETEKLRITSFIDALDGKLTEKLDLMNPKTLKQAI